MQARAARFIASTSVVMLILGTSVSQAAPGGEPGPPGGVPPGQIVSGHLSIVHADNFEGDTRHQHDDSVPGHVLPGMQYWLTTDAGEELLLEFPGHLPEATPEGYYEARGERHGQAFHVSEMRESAAPGGNKPGGGGGGKPPKGGTTPSFVGPRDMIVIPFTFADEATPLTMTPAEMRERGFGDARTVKTWYREASGTTNPSNPVVLKGKNDGTATDKDASFGDVTSVYAIDNVPTRCTTDADGNLTGTEYRTWATAAKAAATADGWDLSGYEHIVYIHPNIIQGTEEGPESVCPYGGLAEIGGDEVWMNGNISLGTWVHELGHNLTLYHSRTLICWNETDKIFYSAGTGCEYEEYGDPFDTMGTSRFQRHYHGRNKGHMSWIPAGNVATGANGGTYTLYPVEMPTASLGLPQVLQMARGRSENIYVDFRQPFGTFDTYGPADDAVTGAMIRTGPSLAANGNSWLIDTSMYPWFTDAAEEDEDEDGPDTEPEFLDAALQVGEGWIDPLSGVYIETVSLGSGTITVRVLTGQSNAAPQVAVGSSSAVILPGVPHQAPGATATDTHKNLGMYRWSWSSCPSTCPALTGVTEDALSGGSDTISGPIYVPTVPGDYTLILTVWDTAGAKTTTEVTETVGI